MTDEEIKEAAFKANRLSLMAREGAKFGDCGRMCDTCAFKSGSVTQLEPANIDAAWNVLLMGGQFNCHPNDQYGDGGKACAGFLYTKQYLKEKFNED